MALLAAAAARRRSLATAARAFSARSDAASRLPVHPSDIRRLARAKEFDKIDSILTPLLSSPPPPPSAAPFLAAVLSSFSSAGMVDRAVTALNSLPITPGISHLNAVLSPLIRRRRDAARVHELFSALSSSLSLKPNDVTYGILIKASCLQSGGSSALQLLDEMEEKKIKSNPVVYTALMDSFYKENKPAEAENLWVRMKEKHIRPDVAAYNVRAMYRAKTGTPQSVKDLITEMEELASLKADTLTYNYLMQAYCTHARMEEAIKVYKGLGEKGCQPNAGTFRILLTFATKCEKLDNAYEVFNDAIQQHVVLDYGTVQTLVKALMANERLDSAKRVVSSLKKKFPMDSDGNWDRLEKLLTPKDTVTSEETSAA